MHLHLPKELTTVTPVSKIVALIMFTMLPIVAFIFGMRYQMMLSEQTFPAPTPMTVSPTLEPIGCTLDVKICADGTAVGRIPPKCEFETCPTSQSIPLFCGGVVGKLCPTGFYCKYEGAYPDAEGTCIKDEVKSIYTCPKSGWVNCMPILNEMGKKACSKEALEWYKVNCPNFKGAAM